MSPYVNHFVERCRHGTVVAQCRCPDPRKVERIVPCPGPPACTVAPARRTRKKP